MAEYFAGGHLRFVNGEWRDDAGDVVEIARVRNGRWIHDINNLYACSECMERETMSQKKLKNYCPNCGAKMEGGEI